MSEARVRGRGLKTRLKKALKHPARSGRLIANRLLAVCGHSDFRKFIVLARSRTGSNLLLSYLNSHPAVFVRGEIFQNLLGRDCQRVLAAVFSRQPRHVKAAGFKIFYYHPLDADGGAVWRELVGRPDLHVIHLRRRNILKTLVSRKIARAQNAWQSSSGPNKRQPGESAAVFIGSEELRRGFIQTREWEKAAEKMFAGHPLLDLYYEDLAADAQAAFARVTDFLGLARRRPRTRLKKQSRQGLKQRLVGYEELKKEFAGSEWAAFFDE